jgi:redox-sensitive bicupin YhaK (pirin superfamily)
VHSERSPEELRGHPMSVSGLQTWLALPDGKEEIAPVFENTSRRDLPDFDAGGVSGRVVIGSFQGLKSAVAGHSDTLYADIRLAAGASVQVPADAEERAIYVLEGHVVIAGDRFPSDRLLVFRPGDEIVISSEHGAHVMLFGGASLGSPRYIWWNFVSSSKERIEQAKEEWRTGRFDIVPGDEEEFIPLPAS